MATSKENQQEIDEIGMKKLKNDLIQFLTFKYYSHNQGLEEEIEKEHWKSDLSNWKGIRSILASKPIPKRDDSFEDDPKRGITVILPKDDTDPEANFRLLKGAAYFPYQLDPICFEKYAYDEDILIQLAFATHGGIWAARNLLSSLDYKFPLIKGHPLCVKKIPQVNKDHSYYELALPEEFHGKSNKGNKNLPFNPKTDAKNVKMFFDYLIEIAKNGKRPTDINYSS